MRRRDQPIHWVPVGAAIIEHRGRVLITRRGPRAHLAGFWEFPGGKREAGETWQECIHREIREELGIEVTPITLFAVIPYRYPHQAVELHFFRCSMGSGVPQALGCAEFRWVSYQDLAHYPFPPADAPVVAKLVGIRQAHVLDRLVVQSP
ncbi:MAG: 8-oxo-dGTP diphosphatase MutT [Nitrospirae bacterium]|nr:MAG: 8-oxo-dGTP diphosphatase MutT [Nitrospirota bacterium]